MTGKQDANVFPSDASSEGMGQARTKPDNSRRKRMR